MNAAEIICGATGGWLILGALIASVPHRLRRKPVECTVAIRRYPPPIAATRPSDASWLDNVPADCLVDSDPILHHRFWDLVDGEKWFA